MRAHHVAYGLGLEASFPLPGMPAADGHGLPRLTLELVPPAELDAAWSGPDERPAWTGTLGDGCSLTIDHGNERDVLFSYADRARFRLDASHTRLECAPLQTGLHWQQVLLSRVLPDIAIIRGYEALHASAIASPQGVVAVAAPSGMGKTTLALELLRRGWRLFADDVLTLGDGGAAGGVDAYPGTPHMNVAVGAGSLGADTDDLGRTLGTLAGERWVAVERAAQAAGRLRMICLLERRAGLPLELRALPPNPLPLAPYMLVLGGDAERERRRFARYADLMGEASLVRLTCGVSESPAELAELIEHAIGQPSDLAVGSSR
jgi:hypothetical protein